MEDFYSCCRVFFSNVCLSVANKESYSGALKACIPAFGSRGRRISRHHVTGVWVLVPERHKKKRLNGSWRRRPGRTYVTPMQRSHPPRLDLQRDVDSLSTLQCASRDFEESLLKTRYGWLSTECQTQVIHDSLLRIMVIHKKRLFAFVLFFCRCAVTHNSSFYFL